MKDPDVQTLVSELRGAFSRLEVLMFDEDYAGILGEGCSSAQIDEASRALGRALPPSYQAFLEMHDGWTDFIGEAPLLAVEDRRGDVFKRRVKEIGDHLRSFGDHDFVPHAFFLLAHPDVSTVLYLDKEKPTEGGELELVEYSLRENELGRYSSFAEYLKGRLKVTQRLIAREEG
ncbi:MAG: SMI1/KNR4 family protein [Nannocystales bacterium]